MMVFKYINFGRKMGYDKPHKDRHIFMGVFAIPKYLKERVIKDTATHEDLAFCADSTIRKGIHQEECIAKAREGCDIRNPKLNISGIGNAAYFALHSKDQLAKRKAEIFCNLLLTTTEGKKILIKCIEKGESDQHTIEAYKPKNMT